jgi:hypothetical protein
MGTSEEQIKLRVALKNQIEMCPWAALCLFQSLALKVGKQAQRIHIYTKREKNYICFVPQKTENKYSTYKNKGVCDVCTSVK